MEYMSIILFVYRKSTLGRLKQPQLIDMPKKPGLMEWTSEYLVINIPG